MLRNRLIITLTFNDGVLFRTKHFTPDYRYTQNFVDAWSVDEVIALDITRPGSGRREHFYEVVNSLASKAFVPLAVGGGVRSVDDFRTLLAMGADKVVVNTAAIERPQFITEGATLYGSQCVVVSIDAQRMADGRYQVFKQFGGVATGLDPVDWARRVQELGAGEIFLTSIDKDGSLEGYDNELCAAVSDAVEIPVIISGGAGKWQDFVDGFAKGRATAVSTSNIYHFTEASIRSAKRYLHQHRISVRNAEGYEQRL